MEKWYFTFGVGTVMANYFVEITGEDENECRSKMFYAFGPNWAFNYSEDEWNKSDFQNKFNLTKFKLPKRYE